MSKSIFKIRRKQLKKQLDRTGSKFKAFGLGVSTGRKIEQDLFKLSKKRLLEQQKLTTNNKDKESVQLVLDEKYPERQDRKLTNKLR